MTIRELKDVLDITTRVVLRPNGTIECNYVGKIRYVPIEYLDRDIKRIIVVDFDELVVRYIENKENYIAPAKEETMDIWINKDS